jgi:hypothetical protein
MELWLHGRGQISAELADRFGLSYCHAHFLGEPNPTPRNSSAIAIAGVCAPTDNIAANWKSTRLPFIRPAFVASQTRWARAIAQIGADEKVDEVVFVDVCASPDHHLQSISSLAEIAQPHRAERDRG